VVAQSGTRLPHHQMHEKEDEKKREVKSERKEK
jgi:hypothetical protein